MTDLRPLKAAVQVVPADHFSMCEPPGLRVLVDAVALQYTDVTRSGTGSPDWQYTDMNTGETKVGTCATCHLHRALDIAGEALTLGFAATGTHDDGVAQAAAVVWVAGAAAYLDQDGHDWEAPGAALRLACLALVAHQVMPHAVRFAQSLPGSARAGLLA